ncbi:Glycosyltransferase 8 domain-containing protein 1 [Biomphalaria glabrata]|nr:glycosyltransferase 8 domain-containing protein 1-like isoform X1 [Biomphalaria glabrata]
MIFEMGILSARRGKRLGVLLAVFWIGALCYFWLPDAIKYISKSDTEKSVEEDNFSLDQTLHVCIASDHKTLGGMIALINSIIINTNSEVKFHLIVDSQSVDRVTIWIKSTKLRYIDFEVKAFPEEWVDGKIKIRAGRKELASPLNYARYYLPRLFPDINDRIVYIDDDCIVQGDIKFLYHMHIRPGHWAAFSADCEGVNKRLSRLSNVYAEFIDFKNANVKKLNMKPSACSFNTGVFVTDLRLWDNNNITQQLEYWMELNTKEEVYGNEKGGGGSQPPMMIVFYNKYTNIESLWHVRHLGLSAGTTYNKGLLENRAKLIHWNGPFKPWGRVAQHSSIWDKYFIPEPSGQFKVVRRAV